MASREQRAPDNAPGRFYVDAHECIWCSACTDVAPAHFRPSDSETYVVCYRQPETPAEEEACQEALAACPVEAIGADGAAPPTEGLFGGVQKAL